MDSTQITVIKRDETTELLDKSKFHRIAVATGLKDDEAGAVSQAIEKRVLEKALASDNTIKSVEIRDIFIEELTKVSRYAAGLYTWYEKTKK